jgi:dienelactone hydrolase
MLVFGYVLQTTYKSWLDQHQAYQASTSECKPTVLVANLGLPLTHHHMSCPDCFRGGAATGTPSGSYQHLHGHKTYIAKPPSPSTTTIILYTDAFGHLLPNNLLLADALSHHLAATLLVPDIIPGGPMSPAILPLMDTFTASSSSYASKALAMARAMAYVIPFFARAAPQKPASTAPCEQFARAVRRDAGQAAKLGLVGYCWGGFQALRIAGLDLSGARLADAVFVAHPASYEPRHVGLAVENGVPVSFAHAALDMRLPMAKIDETRKLMDGKEGFELSVYEGCVHGFAVRAMPGSEKAAEAADQALQQAVAWFKRWL